MLPAGDAITKHTDLAVLTLCDIAEERSRCASQLLNAQSKM